ncbi:MAG TPA: hypothetical protein PKL85_10670, partial [Bacteroidia bacterium]|nr:hypothetical protein [Bacteroidia bacterium]
MEKNHRDLSNFRNNRLAIKNLFALSVFALFQFSGSQLHAQSPEWSHCYGGSEWEYALDFEKNYGNEYYLICVTVSHDGDINVNRGSSDAWLLKLDSLGNIIWQHSYGGSNGDGLASSCQINDHELVFAGGSNSVDGDLSSNNGINDYWIVKIDTGGSIIWQQSFGGSEDEVALSITNTTDGGYLVGGNSASADGDVSNHHGCNGCEDDLWILKLDSLGQLEWENSYGSSGGDSFGGACQTSTGEYYIGGSIYFADGDVTFWHGGFDAWIAKLDQQGTIIWQRSYGGTYDETAESILPTLDGGLIFAGQATSNDGDVSGNHGTADVWVVKLDSNGTIQWQHCYGGSSYDYPNSI